MPPPSTPGPGCSGARWPARMSPRRRSGPAERSRWPASPAGRPGSGPAFRRLPAPAATRRSWSGRSAPRSTAEPGCWSPTPARSPTPASPRRQQVQDVDTRLGLILGGLPENATVVVASMADSGRSPHALAARLLAARGPAPDGGRYTGALLGSRRPARTGWRRRPTCCPPCSTASAVAVPAEPPSAPRCAPVAGGRDVVDRLRAGARPGRRGAGGAPDRALVLQRC